MSLSLKPSRLRVYKDVISLILKYGSKADFTEALENSQFGFGIEDLDDIEPSEAAEHLAEDLEKRGPTFVKIGQLLSTRADLLPPSWLAGLQRLQDDVDSFDFEIIKETIEEDLGVRLSTAFDEFDETPLASASLGQVHRAVLRNSDKQVAVKVQRPDIRQRMMDELAGIADIAHFLEEHSDSARRYRLAAIAEEARKRILQELDYANEANNLNRLRDNLKKFPQLLIPSPIADYCGNRVLTMDFVAGTRITDLSGAVRVDLDGASLADELFHAYLKQVLVDGFFHADPHPGNVLLTRDHRVALIDLGMVGHISDRLRNLLLTLLVSISEDRGDDVAEAAMKIGRPKDDFNRRDFIADMADVVNSRAGASVDELQIGTTVMQVTDVCAKHSLIIPHEMFMLGKMLLNLDMVGRALDPNFRPDEAIQRYAAEIAQVRMKDTLTSGNLLSLLIDAKELFAETPQRINRVLENLSTNEFKVRVDAVDEKALLDGIEKIANRITVGLILGALIVGAAMMMQIESSFTLFGYPGIAMIFFLIASAGALLLAWQVLFGDDNSKSEK